jgi:hypothetical protein
MRRPHCRNEIDGETPYIESVDESNDPFNYRSRVVVCAVAKDAKCDGETELDEDEGEFDPEGNAEDTVLAVVNAETLVFPANEYGGNYVATTRIEMLILVLGVERIENEVRLT